MAFRAGVMPALSMALAALWTVSVETAQCGITGSAHDFSAESWSYGEICVVCHTPHNAFVPQFAPLWNHTSISATYTLYDSDWLTNTPGQPGQQSKTCLSCHDGTVAIDSFGGSSGSEFVSGPALIGTDLSNDHPIGIQYLHEPGINCQNCHQLHPWAFNSVLPFYTGLVECSTCHEVHNVQTAGPHLVRKPLAGSALCLHCHAK